MKSSHSKTLVTLLLMTSCLLANPLQAATQNTAAHEIDFWRAIAKNHYAVPEHESADALSNELSALLASPNPELRDDLAYSIFARWIARANILSTQQLIVLTDEWSRNLTSGIGEVGNDQVVKRTFSALCLSSLAERESKTPFMGADRYHRLMADSITYLLNEKDLRGYDSRLGWIHATAHTADLLQALANSPQMSKDEQANILSAIANRLSSAPQVYVQGEQDRLAAAVTAVIHRPDFAAAAFDAWLTQIQSEDQNVWANPLSQESLAVYQNHTYMLQALAVRLALEPESVVIARFKESVLAILRKR